MKRKGKLRNAIALALMLGMGCMGTAEAAINLGDVDGSGVVDMRDIDALEKYLQTGNSRFLASSKNADVNLDNRIDREDLRLLKQRVYYPGDVNGDNLVDDRDAKAARDYMVTERYNYLADFSNDGSVTLQDYASACNLVEKAKSMMKGDLNGDGEISISDASLIVMYIKGLTKNINRLAADVNNDGRIDSTDKKIIIDKFFNVSRYAPDGEVTSLYSPSAHVLVVEGSVWDNDDLNREIVVQVNAGPNASDSKQFTVPRGSKQFSQKMSFPNVSGVQTVNVYALDVGENRKDKLLKSAQIDFKGTSQVEKYVVTTNGATLALRSGPGTNYGIRARMPRGSVVEVYSINNGWAKLSYNGMSGYAYAQYLNKVGPIDDRVAKALAWIESNLGRKIGSGQCVALITAYASQLGLNNPIAGGNACDYATKPLQAGWTRVAGGKPQSGDILVYVGAKYGHVAICTGDNVSFHQNMKGLYVEKKVNWAYNQKWYSKKEQGWKRYWGYIRPNI